MALSACARLPGRGEAPPVDPAPGVGPPAVAASAPVVPPAPIHVPVPPRIGLALGGGAARGFAHIGVIQVLEEQGIVPSLVVGTSAGSFVAALYASGKSGVEMGSLATSMDEGAIADWSYPGRGVIRGEAIARYVREHTSGLSIQAMRIPLGIVATDLGSGEPILFRVGDPGTAVRASSSVPGVFMPVPLGGREYVDGGLVAPVPVRFAREMGAQLVIAVDISAVPDGQPTGDTLHLMLQTFAIMARSLNRYELRDADIVLRPALPGMGATDFNARGRAVQAGRAAALAALPQIRARLAALTR